MSIEKNPYNLRPDILKNRARNLRDAIMTRGTDRAAINALRGEGFKDIEKEVEGHVAAYWNEKHADHQAATEMVAGLYEIIEGEI